MIAPVAQLTSLSLQAALLVTLPALGGRGHAAAIGGAVAEGEACPGPPPPHHLSRHAGEKVINGLFLASCWYQSWLPRQKVTPRLNTRAKLQTLSVELCVSSLQKPLIDFHISIMFSLYQQFYISYFFCLSPDIYRASSSIFAVVQTIVIRPRGWDQKQNKQKLVKGLKIFTWCLVFTFTFKLRLVTILALVVFKASVPPWHWARPVRLTVCWRLMIITRGPGPGERTTPDVGPWHRDQRGRVMHHTDVTTCTNLVTT